jgi:hypothetical protein
MNLRYLFVAVPAALCILGSGAPIVALLGNNTLSPLLCIKLTFSGTAHNNALATPRCS